MNEEYPMDTHLKGYADKYAEWRKSGSFTFSSRIIPVQESFASQQWVLPGEQVLRILIEARSIALTNCICRTHYHRCDRPRDVVVDKSGYIYVADTGNNRIQNLDSNFKNITVWGSKGSGSGKFNAPTGIAADSSRNVYVTDTINNRIQKFSTDGVFITKWGSKGSGNSNFKTPESLAVNSAGRVYIADTGNNRISVFKSNAPLSLLSIEGIEMKEQNFTSPVNVVIPVVNHQVVAAPVVKMPVRSSPVLSPTIGPVIAGSNPVASVSGARIVERSIL